MTKNNPILSKLKEYRKEKSWTIKQVALMLSISRSMYGHIENGEKRLSYKVAIDLANIFGVTPDDLFLKDFQEFFKDSHI